MGRPLNKKYFGNRNIGTTGTTDDGIGGEGVASYSTIVAGSGFTATPTANISLPDIPGGIRATGTFLYTALSAAVDGSGATAYPVGTVVSVAGGATFAVDTLVPTVALVNVTIGTAADLTFDPTQPGDQVVGTSVNITGLDTAGTGVGPSTYYISASPAPTATSCTITDTFANAVAGTNTLGVTVAGPTTGLTFTLRDGGGLGHDAAGIVATVTTTTGGSYSTFAATPKNTTNTVSATGLTLNLLYGLSSVTVVTRGSGYTTPANAALLGLYNGASATAVLTTDTGAVGSSTNQENAIIAYAYVTGGSRQVADIIKQVSGKRYKVKTATGTMICKLKSSASSAAGEMEIVATDAASGTYYVTKLTAHKATLTRGTGTVYVTGVATPWTFSTADAVYCKIPNA